MALPIFSRDTTGEKEFEVLYPQALDLERFNNLGIVKNKAQYEAEALDRFESEIHELKSRGRWSKDEIVSLFYNLMPAFGHEEKGKSLDGKM